MLTPKNVDTPKMFFTPKNVDPLKMLTPQKFGLPKNVAPQKLLTPNIFDPQQGRAVGVPWIFFHPKSYFFCELKPHAKFRNPTITPSGRKVTRRREEREKNNAVNSGHLVPWQRTKPLGPKANIIRTWSILRILKISHILNISMLANTTGSFKITSISQIANTSRISREPILSEQQIFQA